MTNVKNRPSERSITDFCMWKITTNVSSLIKKNDAKYQELDYRVLHSSLCTSKHSPEVGVYAVP